MGTIAQKGSRLAETKALLKQRLAEKGVDVSDEDVFYHLADKVGEIAAGLDTSDATATADDILLGKTAYLAAGKETGKIQTLGEQTIIPDVSDKTIGPGVYLSGQQTVKGDANLVPANIKSGVSIFGVNGTCSPEIGTANISIINESSSNITVGYVSPSAGFDYLKIQAGMPNSVTVKRDAMIAICSPNEIDCDPSTTVESIYPGSRYCYFFYVNKNESGGTIWITDS